MKALLILFSLGFGLTKQDSFEVKRTYEISTLSDFHVVVNNINGLVEVEPSLDNNVYLELEIVVNAATDKELERAKSELALGERQTDDSLVLFPKAPFIIRCQSGFERGVWIEDEPSYDFKYQFRLKVPKTVNLWAKTINNGNILVKDMAGIVKTGNVNGDITIENARDVRSASTVNGDVTINFVKNPSEPVKFNTVNGDFNFELPEDFNAKIIFNSMNGELNSSFDYSRLNPSVTKSEEKGKFRIEHITGVEIGSGGPEWSFRSINGSVYLRKSNTR